MASFNIQNIFFGIISYVYINYLIPMIITQCHLSQCCEIRNSAMYYTNDSCNYLSLFYYNFLK